jgi:uncharacterized protein (TIGR04141 family)
VDLSLNLLIDRVSNFDAVIPEEKKGPTEFQPVPLREGFAAKDDLSCWMKKNEPRPTDWSAWLEEGFDFSGKRPESQSCGCVVLIKSEERVFAASFGTGRHAIPEELVECDFGLTVALNEVNPKQLRSLVTKTIDVKTRQRDTKKAGGADVPEFALDLDVEWLRAAEGRSGRPDCNVVVGSDTLHLMGWRRSLPDLSHACSEFLASFRRGVPEVFAFAESVKPIPENDPIHARLEGDLQAAIQLRYFEQLSLGIDPATARMARRCILTYGKKSWNVPSLDDDSLRQALDELSVYEPRFDVARAHLKLFDGDDEDFFNKPLVALLQMEIDRDGNSYIRVEKRWFRCRDDYVARVNSRVDELEDLTQVLALPTWSKTNHPKEEDYNAHVAHAKDWLLQDQVPFYSPEGEKLEPCDLLTQQRNFIHVKEGKDSSTLSHLFSQASGSAVLLRRHQPFFEEMRARYEKKWSDAEFETGGRPKIVLAIARPRKLELFGKMLLSRINVLEHARRIQSHGFDFAISRVDLD